MQKVSNWSLIPPLSAERGRLTLQLSIGGMFFGLVLGFILALMRMSPVWPVKWLARMYISIFRGTPLIAQLFMIYYGLPQFGIELDPDPGGDDRPVVEYCGLCGGNAARGHRLD